MEEKAGITINEFASPLLSKGAIKEHPKGEKDPSGLLITLYLLLLWLFCFVFVFVFLFLLLFISFLLFFCFAFCFCFYFCFVCFYVFYVFYVFYSRPIPTLYHFIPGSYDFDIILAFKHIIHECGLSVYSF